MYIDGERCNHQYDRSHLCITVDVHGIDKVIVKTSKGFLPCEIKHIRIDLYNQNKSKPRIFVGLAFYSIIFPSILIVTTCHGMNFPLF